MLHEHFAIEPNETSKRVKVVIEQLLTQVRRQIGLGIIQERSDIILQRAFAAALIVHEEWNAGAQHDVA